MRAVAVYTGLGRDADIDRDGSLRLVAVEDLAAGRPGNRGRQRADRHGLARGHAVLILLAVGRDREDGQREIRVVRRCDLESGELAWGQRDAAIADSERVTGGVTQGRTGRNAADGH